MLVDGRPVLSCLMLALEAEGRAIDTIEGLAQDAALHPLQAACADLGGAQCGYCTPGILLTAKALLEQRPNPTREQIRNRPVRQSLPVHRLPADLRGCGRGDPAPRPGGTTGRKRFRLMSGADAGQVSASGTTASLARTGGSSDSPFRDHG